MPGDVIRITDGVVYVNEVSVKKEKSGYFEDYHRNGYIEKYDLYRESITDERQYYILDDIFKINKLQLYYLFWKKIC